MEMSQKRLQLTSEYHKELYSDLSSSFATLMTYRIQ